MRMLSQNLIRWAMVSCTIRYIVDRVVEPNLAVIRDLKTANGCLLLNYMCNAQ